MSSREGDVDLRLQVVAEADADRIAELASSLRRELLELDGTNVATIHEGDAPPGTRAADLLVVGALLVKIAKRAGNVAEVVRAVQRWAANGRGTVTLEIDGDKISVTGASTEQQDRLISAWVERHAPPQ
jgi:hypothetical protein